MLRQNRGVIAFGRTKHGVRKLAAALRRLQHEAVELQGNMSQSARDRAMALFRFGRSDVLVATNVAARGLDISDVGLIVKLRPARDVRVPHTPSWPHGPDGQ